MISKALIELNGGDLDIFSDGIELGSIFSFTMKMSEINYDSHAEIDSGQAHQLLFPSTMKEKNIMTENSDRESEFEEDGAGDKSMNLQLDNENTPKSS